MDNKYLIVVPKFCILDSIIKNKKHFTALLHDMREHCSPLGTLQTSWTACPPPQTRIVARPQTPML